MVCFQGRAVIGESEDVAIRAHNHGALTVTRQPVGCNARQQDG